MGEVGQLSPLKVNVKFFHSFFLYLKLISVIYFYFGTHLLVFFCIFFYVTTPPIAANTF